MRRTICGNCRGAGVQACPACGHPKLVACPEQEASDAYCDEDCYLCGGDGVVLLLRAGRCTYDCGPSGVECQSCGGRGTDQQLQLTLQEPPANQYKQNDGDS